MDIEKLAHVTKSGALIGVANREEIHRLGLWHETFHCWVVTRELGRRWIHLQLRSPGKADFPGLFDITAAGHLGAAETVRDGVRELKEELGLSVRFEQLTPLGVICDEIKLPGFTDRERAFVFLHEEPVVMDACRLQREEVAGLAKMEFGSFFELCTKKIERTEIEGFRETGEGRTPFHQTVSLEDFVPHETAYWEEVAVRCRKALMDE